MYRKIRNITLELLYGVIVIIFAAQVGKSLGYFFRVHILKKPKVIRSYDPDTIPPREPLKTRKEFGTVG